MIYQCHDTPVRQNNYDVAAFVLTCLCQMKSHAKLFQSKKTVVSFVHMMGFISKILITPCYQRMGLLVVLVFSNNKLLNF